IQPYMEQQNLYNLSLIDGKTTPMWAGGIGASPGSAPWPTDFPYYGPQWSYAVWSLPNGNPKVYICPSDDTLNMPLNLGYVDPNLECSYTGNGLIFLDFNSGMSLYPASIPDGTSNTLFFTENEANCGPGGGEHNWVDDGTLFGAYASQRAGIAYG